jgi:hypothetical protein
MLSPLVDSLWFPIARWVGIFRVDISIDFDGLDSAAGSNSKRVIRDRRADQASCHLLCIGKDWQTANRTLCNPRVQAVILS